MREQIEKILFIRFVKFAAVAGTVLSSPDACCVGALTFCLNRVMVGIAPGNASVSVEKGWS
jgi:hypothetical protein